MAQTDPNLLVIKRNPLELWIVSAVFSILGLIFLFSPGMGAAGLISLGVGIGVLLIASVNTLTLDKKRNHFSLQRRFIWRTTLEQRRLDELGGFILQQNQDTDGGRTYRVVAILASGEIIPLTSAYTSGREGKRRQAEQLNQWLEQAGVRSEAGAPVEADWPGGAAAFVQPAQPAPADNPRLRQAPGIDPPPPATGQSGETDGVSWQIERLPSGSAPITRWFSPDFKFTEGFLLLAQKPKDMRVAGKLLGGLVRLFGQQALRLYGFGPADTPGLESAAPLEPPEPRLEPHYVSLTSNAFAARQALNPWVIIPLAAWGARSPLQPASRAEDQSQLVILFSPRGVYVAGVGADSPEEIEALSNLGVEIVRALGG